MNAEQIRVLKEFVESMERTLKYANTVRGQIACLEKAKVLGFHVELDPNEFVQYGTSSFYISDNAELSLLRDTLIKNRKDVLKQLEDALEKSIPVGNRKITCAQCNKEESISGESYMDDLSRYLCSVCGGKDKGDLVNTIKQVCADCKKEIVRDTNSAAFWDKDGNILCRGCYDTKHPDVSKTKETWRWREWI